MEKTVSYIVKRSDGAVWGQCSNHPAYLWQDKDAPPEIYKSYHDAIQVKLRVQNFMVHKDQTVTVEKYP